MKKITAFMLAVFLSVISSGCKEVDESVPVLATVQTSLTAAADETTVTTASSEHKETVSFVATGDNLIHSSIYNQAARRSESGGYDFVYPYADVKDIIEKADISIINQETLICDGKLPPSSYPRFNSPPELGDYMIKLGFDVFTIANNHILDEDEQGLGYCLDYWDKKEVVVTGAFRNKADSENIRTNEVNGIKFAYLSYTESTNGLALPSGSEYVIGNAFDIDGMTKDIKKASEIADVCVVSLHWGVEGSDVISDYQRQTAKLLSDAGADIIIGNHPHVLRNIEMIKREDGSETLCAYSLGNFISAQSKGQNLIGGILKFNVSMDFYNDEKVDKEPTITDIKLIPIVTQYESGYSNIRIIRLENYTRELAKAHGVHEYSDFGYDYIFDVLEKNIDEKYLELPPKQP